MASTKEEHKFFLHTRMEGIYGTGHKYGHFTKETPATTAAAHASVAAAFSVAPNKTCTSSCAGHHHPYSTAPPLSLFSLSCCSSSYPFTSSKFYSLLEELRPEGRHWQKTQITVANPLEQNYWTGQGPAEHHCTESWPVPSGRHTNEKCPRFIPCK